MSEHPDVPRVEFNEDGESMNVKEAVTRFRLYLDALRLNEVSTFTLNVTVRPCDCDQTLEGRDPYCPLHGDKS